MRYRLRTLLIAAVILLPVLAYLTNVVLYVAEEVRYHRAARERNAQLQKASPDEN
jgi:hypothetical protein